VIQAGDSLWTIARDTLGDGDRWEEIWEANREALPNPRVLRPGARLQVARTPISSRKPIAAASPSLDAASSAKSATPAKVAKAPVRTKTKLKPATRTAIKQSKPTAAAPVTAPVAGTAAESVSAAASARGSHAATAANFADIPTAHWAAKAVSAIAESSKLAQAFPDSKKQFRGAEPLTRRQLARLLSSLVKDFEKRSATAWWNPAPKSWRLADLRESDPERLAILDLVNTYRLWDGVPAVSQDAFDPDAAISREEVAQVLKNLLANGQAVHAVLPDTQQRAADAFPDVAVDRWSYEATRELRKRDLMVGFPDDTFRPDGSLTRFQYAAVAAKALGLVRKPSAEPITASPAEPPTEKIAAPPGLAEPLGPPVDLAPPAEPLTEKIAAPPGLAEPLGPPVALAPPEKLGPPPESAPPLERWAYHPPLPAPPLPPPEVSPLEATPSFTLREVLEPQNDTSLAMVRQVQDLYRYDFPAGDPFRSGRTLTVQVPMAPVGALQTRGGLVPQSQTGVHSGLNILYTDSPDVDLLTKKWLLLGQYRLEMIPGISMALTGAVAPQFIPLLKAPGGGTLQIALPYVGARAVLDAPGEDFDVSAGPGFPVVGALVAYRNGPWRAQVSADVDAVLPDFNASATAPTQNPYGNYTFGVDYALGEGHILGIGVTGAQWPQYTVPWALTLGYGLRL
jgi:hypothetical protein